ncbi:hypothetical protein [Actinoplanes sp. NPDC051859]|uniref:hypothetical protein n=1 Tax=Actinoplanes sp. NPDC051859 TaxID=3363909 RepID=UPI0037AAE100
MQSHLLRSGWPEQLLAGRYTLRADRQVGTVRVLAGLIDIATITRDRAGAWAPEPPGPKVVAGDPASPLITLLAHVRPQLPAEPTTASDRLALLVDRRLAVRTRLRRSLSDLRHAYLTRKPPVPTWDVLDNRFGLIVGRLTRPGADRPTDSRTFIKDLTGRTRAVMVEPHGSGRILFLARKRPVAFIAQQHEEQLVDVTATSQAGLDPRLVLACAILRFAPAGAE